jgi:hypothetical protein
MIKAFIPAVALATALVAPTFAFAQSNDGALTRAQVQAQLVQLEKAGYTPGSDHANYPQNLQAAQARVNAEQGSTAYGASTAGSSASGLRVANRAPMSGQDSTYFGH